MYGSLSLKWRKSCAISASCTTSIGRTNEARLLKLLIDSSRHQETDAEGFYSAVVASVRGVQEI